MAREGAEDCKCLIYLLIYSNKLAYLQLITVFVYGTSPPKSHEQGYLNFYLNSFLEQANLLKTLRKKSLLGIFQDLVEKFQMTCFTEHLLLYL